MAKRRTTSAPCTRRFSPTGAGSLPRCQSLCTFPVATVRDAQQSSKMRAIRSAVSWCSLAYAETERMRLSVAGYSLGTRTPPMVTCDAARANLWGLGGGTRRGPCAADVSVVHQHLATPPRKSPTTVIHLRLLGGDDLRLVHGGSVFSFIRSVQLLVRSYVLVSDIKVEAKKHSRPCVCARNDTCIRCALTLKERKKKHCHICHRAFC